MSDLSLAFFSFALTISTILVLIHLSRDTVCLIRKCYDRVSIDSVLADQ